MLDRQDRSWVRFAAYDLDWPHRSEQLIPHDLIGRNEVQMGSNDLHIAALVGGQPSLAENASIPQAKPVSPVLPASEAPAVFPSDSQQDRVSLSGTLPPQRQQGALASGNTQLAAFTLLAQQITFSPGQSTADVFTSSTFPAAATLAGQNSASGVVTTSASSSDAASASATSAPKSAATVVIRIGRKRNMQAW